MIIKHKQNIDFSFEILSKGVEHDKGFTDTCSGSRSDCCTRVCSDNCMNPSTQTDWANYFELNAGVVQY